MRTNGVHDHDLPDRLHDRRFLRHGSAWRWVLWKHKSFRNGGANVSCDHYSLTACSNEHLIHSDSCASLSDQSGLRQRDR